MKPLIDPINTSDGKFHGKDKQTGDLATIVTPEYMNNDQDATRSMQREIISILTAAGINPEEATDTQLLTALKKVLITADDERVKNALQKESNLSDVSDKAKALANLDGVPTTRKINGHALAADANVTAQDIFNGQAVAIGNAVDLNTLQTPGLYFQAANAQAASGKNYPEAIAGSLEVYKHAGITQIYRVYNNSRSYIRTQYTGTWTAWVKQYDAANKPTAADVGALPITGGTLNGNLTVQNTIQIGSIGKAILNIGDNDSGLRSSKDGQVDLWANSKMLGYWNTATFAFTGQIIPTNYTNFDGRYQKGNTASRAASGWYKDTNTGMIFQWGTVNRTNYSTPVTFPIAFPSVCVGVSATLRNYINDISSSTFNIRAVNVSRTGFQYGSGGTSESQAFWFAIGY